MPALCEAAAIVDVQVYLIVNGTVGYPRTKILVTRCLFHPCFNVDLNTVIMCIYIYVCVCVCVHMAEKCAEQPSVHEKETAALFFVAVSFM